MATFNTNTVREEGRAREMAHCFTQCGIDFLGIQEHRRVHEEATQFTRVEGQYLITSSAWRNLSQAAVGGVGLMLSPKARKALRIVTPVTHRILVAEFDSNPVTTVIVVYSPTNVAPVEEAESFYERLGEVIRDVPAHNFLTVLGDFNALLGPEDALYTYHKETNRNGKLLADLLVEHDLLAANTQFRKRKGKRWTFLDRCTKAKRQLDYILVRKKWRNSVLNAEPYHTFCTVGSDHRVVSMRVRLSLRVPKPSHRTRYDWKLFSASHELQEQYTVEVRNRFGVLGGGEDANGKYQRFVEANRRAMEACVPVKERKKRVSFLKHPEIVRARNIMEAASLKSSAASSEEDNQQLKEAKALLYNTYDNLKEQEIRAKIQRVENLSSDSRHGEAWAIINEITGRKKPKEGQVAGVCPEERVKTWYNHFQSLLGSGSNTKDTEEVTMILTENTINDGPFTPDEYTKVKVSIKQGKSSGPDEIPPEVLKNCDLDNIILEICNQALISGRKPDLWSLSCIVPVPKSGDLSKTDNYRGISLSCIIAKMYNRMILNRIRPTIDPQLRANQNGFRPKRTTITQIMALRRIIEGVREKNLPAVLTFIDFKKAFDSISRDKMFKILKAYSIPPNLLNAIINMYTNTRAKVRTPDGETEEFEIKAGVLQGDTLAPFLFVIVLDYALRQAICGREEDLGFTLTPRRSARIQAKVITDLDFADDICLLSDNMQQAQQLLTLVETECNKVGLHLNSRKTEVMTYNIKDSLHLKVASGAELKNVEDFKYLGSWVDSTEKDIKIRKALAWQALNRMGTIWRSKMSRETKVGLFRATVETVLLYGSETWTMTPVLEKSLNGCYTRMLRAVLDIKWYHHMPNKELYGSMSRVGDTVAARRMQMAGHCFRHKELPASDLIIWAPTQGVRARGRRRVTYVDLLKRDAGVGSDGELATCMMDRSVWRTHVRTRLRPT